MLERHARSGAGLVAVLACCAFTSSVWAHARWVSPKPRNQRDDYKDFQAGFVAPCGVNRTAMQPVTSYRTGATVEVQFEETVDHPGCFLVDFSANDRDFTMLANVKQTPTGPTPRPYRTTITLPAGVQCTACTLRVRQLMLNSNTAPCPPATAGAASTYYSCANLLVGDTVDAGSTADARPPTDATLGSDARDAVVITAVQDAGATGGTTGSTGGASGATGGTTGSAGSAGSATGGAAGGSGAAGAAGAAGSPARGGSGGAAAGPIGGSAGSGSASRRSAGGGCRISGESAPAGAALLALVAWVALRAGRRRRI